MSVHAKTALVIGLILLALGLAGNDDYAAAVAIEKRLCARSPSPEWCP